MIGRLRRVVPLLELVAFTLPFLVWEGLIRYVEWRFGGPVQDPKPHIVAGYCLRIPIVCYAVSRIVRTHPLFQPGYRKWLEQTPWTVQKPLPKGPVELVWEDVVVLGGLLTLHAMLPVAGSVKLLNLFLLSQGLILAGTFFATGISTFGYLCLFGLGLAVRFWASPWPCFAIAASTYLVAYEGLWQSLSRFPWAASELQETLRRVFPDNMRSMATSLGWPHDPFLKEVRDAGNLRVNRLDALLISMLVGFGIFCFLALLNHPRDRIGFSGFCLVLIPISMSIRLQVYCRGCAGPISLWGRILNGWWIIPGYDRFYVGPLLTWLAAGATLGSLYLAGVPLEIALPASVSAALATALLTPPRLRDWRLTGKYRMTGPAGNDTAKSPYVRAG